MSDYADSVRRSKGLAESRNIESRLMFGAFYVLFLFRAMASRLMPWRGATLDRTGGRESIFREASGAASVLVASSFMGL